MSQINVTRLNEKNTNSFNHTDIYNEKNVLYHNTVLLVFFTKYKREVKCCFYREFVDLIYFSRSTQLVCFLFFYFPPQFVRGYHCRSLLSYPTNRARWKILS